jgi:enoyl-CoA hydratase/carnithine racemase
VSDIIVHKNDGILRLTLNRVVKRNALTAEMYLSMSNALDEVRTDASIKVALIDAEGPHFSAGNDIAEFLGGSYSLNPGSPWRRFAESLPAFNKPIVAAVQGYAVGIGLTMLLHCDIVLVDGTAKLSAPFAQLGLVPEVGSSGLLPARVGNLKANEVFLLGRIIEAAEAERLGLVNTVVPEGKVREAAHEVAGQIAKLPEASVAHIKRLGRSTDVGIMERIESECEAFIECLSSEQTKVILAGLKQHHRPR